MVKGVSFSLIIPLINISKTRIKSHNLKFSHIDVHSVRTVNSPNPDTSILFSSVHPNVLLHVLLSPRSQRCMVYVEISVDSNWSKCGPSIVALDPGFRCATFYFRFAFSFPHYFFFRNL